MICTPESDGDRQNQVFKSILERKRLKFRFGGGQMPSVSVLHPRCGKDKMHTLESLTPLLFHAAQNIHGGFASIGPTHSAIQP